MRRQVGRAFLTVFVIFFAFLFIAARISNAAQDGLPPIPKACGETPVLLATTTSLQAVALDSSTRGIEPVPAAVAEKILDYGMRIWKHFYDLGLQSAKDMSFSLDMSIPDCVLKPTAIFGSVQRVQYSNGVDLYIAELHGIFGYEEVRLILYDSTTGTLTGNPPEIFSKWRSMAHDPSLKGEFVKFEDLDRDGRNEIVALEYMHNGTLYNGHARHYFKVDDSLNLHEVLVLEEETLIPIEPGGVVKRFVEWVDENALDLVVRTISRSVRMRETETRRLRRVDGYAPYQLVDDLKDDEHSWLVSGCSNTPSNEFLAHGCQFRY